MGLGAYSATPRAERVAATRTRQIEFPHITEARSAHWGGSILIAELPYQIAPQAWRHAAQLAHLPLMNVACKPHVILMDIVPEGTEVQTERDTSCRN